MRLPRLALALAALAAAAAQTPGLRLSAPALARPAWQATVHNDRPSPAVAYIIRVSARDRLGRAAGSPGGLVDALAPASRRRAIPPGAAIAVRMGGPGWRDVAFSADAAVYADGFVSGDPNLLRQIAALWQFQQDDLRQDIALLDSPALQTGGPAAAAALFRRRQAAHAEDLHARVSPALARLPFDAVCASAAATLADPRNQDARAAAASLRNTLQAWYDRISALLPKVQAAMPR